MQSEIFEFYKSNFRKILICENSKECDIAYNVLKFLGFNVFVLPDFRAIKGDDLRSFNKELIAISKELSDYHKCSENKILISPIRTILNKLPSPNLLHCITLSFGDELDQNLLKSNLIKMGYSIVDIVQSPTEASFRGDVVDIFGVDEKAYRILFDFNQIESIKELDVYTQLSKNELESIEITPLLANLSDEEFDELNSKCDVINDLNSFGFWEIKGFINYANPKDCILLHNIFQDEIQNLPNDFSIDDFETLPPAKTYKDLEISLNNDFLELNKNKKINIIARNETLLSGLDVKKFNNVSIIQSDVILNIASSDEIFISLNKKIPKVKKRKSNIIIDELRVGDLIVHQNYGIAKFLGLELVDVLGVKKEFLTLLYQNNDKLLLPVENLDMIDRYVGVGNLISLDKLGKSNFTKLKEKVRQKLFIIASKIIALAAQRELKDGIFIDTPINQMKFIQSAGFDYTSDQIKAVDEILSDFKSNKIMDRLLCGDVGFGKTEVAMNAIFACVNAGFKALFFVPTTLLSSQHYKTMQDRFKSFDICVYKLDRFSTAKEKKIIKEKLLSDEAFVCIGTHALLNEGVKNLGLIIVDEEHKFGVKQKEKLKDISSNAHLLSMSATPIPRSLNMALSSIKSYSNLLTPPALREDIRSTLKEFDEVVIKEAILRELRRGGQIFYVHNHIKTLDNIKRDLLEILPNLKILILHSKVDPKTTEEEILKFLNKEYDLLLATSIVESGIHMPNVNTIIIDNADRYGIADLHQLRGRVGRSDKEGYCYFLIGDEVSDNAIKRLNALTSNSYLGAGSTLAYHDLEIRGGGNLLGSEQSGHIEGIGYSLYLKMLEDEINKLLNNKEIINNEIDLKLIINAYLSPDLITEDRLRLDIYKRLSKAKEIDKILEIQSEIEDRFGSLDECSKNFINLMIIKNLAINQSIKSISNYKENITISYYDDKKTILKAKDSSDFEILNEILIYLRKNR